MIWNLIKTKSTKAQCPEVVKQKNDVLLILLFGAFMVNRSRDSKYSLTVFPKESWSCPETSRCYHIIAVEISNEKKVIRLGEKNVTLRMLRSAGQKKADRVLMTAIFWPALSIDYPPVKLWISNPRIAGSIPGLVSILFLRRLIWDIFSNSHSSVISDSYSY